MRRRFFPFLARVTLLVMCLAGVQNSFATFAGGREKTAAVSKDDPTYRVYDLLDKSYEGKLADFYLLADVYQDADHPGTELQHVLRVQYDKSLFFGKFRIQVRSLAKLTPDQLKSYTLEQLYDFASDSEKFEKIEPGTFGQKGDLYLRANGDRPLASAPVTPEIQAAYQKFLNQYLLPALSKGKSPN